MRKIFTTYAFLIFLLPQFLNAQVPPVNSLKEIDPFAHRKSVSSFVSIPLDEDEINADVAARFLRSFSKNFEDRFSLPRLQHYRENQGSKHFLFQQYFHNIPVFGSSVKVNIDSKSSVRSIFDNSYDASNWNFEKLQDGADKIQLNKIISEINEERQLPDLQITGKKVIAVFDDTPMVLAEIEIWDDKTNEHLLLLLDNDLQLFLQRDLRRYNTEVDATLMVFNPDPLTTAKRIYGPPFVDDNDSDIPEINAQRVPLTAPVTLDSNVYRLENQYVRIENISAPNDPTVVSSVPFFDFTRAHPGFEQVNAFYHISNYNLYIQSLGFADLVNYQIRVDAQGRDDDNSYFSSGIFGPQIVFGTGGVDDAEDADVIIHEYGHAISAAASPNTNFGYEREAAEEGFCDFFATSYSRSIDTFGWRRVFTWDGHNTFWIGRNAASQKIYPDSLNMSVKHVNADIYNTALMQLWEIIGKEKTERLVLKSLYSLNDGISMKDVAMLLFIADDDLYNSENFCAIYYTLLLRGLTDTFALSANCKKLDTTIRVNAGTDRVTCPLEPVSIGDPMTQSSGINYSWFPPTGILSAGSSVTFAAPEKTTVYYLTASLFDGPFNIDSVTVIVEQCDIRVNNTYNFTRFHENAIVTFPYNSSNNTVELFDISGKRLHRVTGLSADDFTISPTVLPAAGVYFLRIRAGDQKKTVKLVKVE